MHDGVPPKNIIDMMGLFIDKRINLIFAILRLGMNYGDTQIEKRC